ncbi:MAG TPA: hypothetical protein DEB05_07840 [Firmicutes bacterium]|jgi:hypothetical protein|nr:hypothetical protein [Bacillota bacterium]
MNINILLQQMSTEEKIRTMEAIWDDLCKQADNLPSSSWHVKVLNEREKQVKQEESKFIDWDKAKKHIRDTIS